MACIWDPTNWCYLDTKQLLEWKTGAFLGPQILEWGEEWRELTSWGKRSIGQYFQERNEVMIVFLKQAIYIQSAHELPQCLSHSHLLTLPAPKFGLLTPLFTYWGQATILLF